MSQGVFVCGPFRCMTTLTLQVVESCGASIGNRAALGSDTKYGPAGSLENVPLQSVAEKMLGALNISPTRPGVLPADWPALLEPTGLVDEMRSVAADMFNGLPLWAWKSATAVPLIPVFETIWPNMRYIVCVRNPLNAVASMVEKLELPEETCWAVWYYLLAAAMETTPAKRRIVVVAETLLESPAQVAVRIADFLGAARPETKAVNALSQTEAVTHRSTYADLAQASKAPNAIKAYHSWLIEGRGHWQPNLDDLTGKLRRVTLQGAKIKDVLDANL